MRMCYAGALAMPSSYVVMDEEEMTYLEGGSYGQLPVKASYVTKIGALAAAAPYAGQALATAGGASYSQLRLAKEIRAHAWLFYGGVLGAVEIAAIKKITGLSNSTINNTISYIISHSNPIDLGGDSATRVAVYNAMWQIGI